MPRPAALAPTAALAFLLGGLVARLAGSASLAGSIWTAGVVLVGLPLVARTGLGVLQGRFAADLVAALAILVSLILAEPLAGLVVTLMQSGGEALEQYAARRATRALSQLEAEAPQVAHRLEAGGPVDVPVEAIDVGDRILVRPGEMVPCDGEVLEGEAAADVSRVTGEPVPVHARPGVDLRSGTMVVDGPLTLVVRARASESLYAQIVELVRSAQASKAPFQRMADRVAVWFTPLTLAVCALAWGLSGDPDRVLSVLVVATPCPLILAAPVAFVGGINRAARRGIVVRHGGALESLARTDVVVFDKTGTVTLGHPDVATVKALAPWTESDLIRLAAGVEEGAGHPLARSVVSHARRRGLAIPVARNVRESPGRGVTGLVEDRWVAVGSRSLVAETAPEARADLQGLLADSDELHALVAIDGRGAGVIGFRDHPRPGMTEALTDLRAGGIDRLVLLSGDHTRTAEAIGRSLGFAEIAGDLLPADKVARVEGLRRAGHQVLMVGDGINDAPALTAATVGMAIARHGGGIAAESADVVLLAEDPGRVAEAVRLGRRTLAIARQSVLFGLGLSGSAMVVAAFGHIPPAAGALLQEGIDLAVIVHALRAAVPARH